MAGPTVSLGLTLIVPAVKGGRNWYDEFITFTNALSSHDHTGGGNGTQISGSAIKLINNDYLQGTEFGGGAADIITVNTSDEVEFGVYDFRLNGDILVDKASTLKITHEGAQDLILGTNNADRWLVGATNGNWVPIVDSSQDIGSIAAHVQKVYSDEFVSQSGGVLTAGTEDSNNFNLQTNNTLRWLLGGSNGNLVPNLDSTYDIGTASAHVQSVWTRVLQSTSATQLQIGTNDINNIRLFTNAVTRFTINGNTGNITPGANLTQDLGSSSLHFASVYATAFRGNLASALNIGTDSAQGIDFFTNGVDRWRMESAGSIRPAVDNTYSIGTSSFHVSSISSRTFQSNSGAQLSIGTNDANQVRIFTNGGTRWLISTAGHLDPNGGNTYDIGDTTNRVRTIYSNNVLNTSDRRIKENIQPIGSALDKVLALEPVNFNFIKEYDPEYYERVRVGFIAQDVREFVPEAVVGEDNGKEFGEEGFEPLSMQAEAIIPYLVKAVKELNTKIEELRNG